MDAGDKLMAKGTQSQIEEIGGAKWTEVIRPLPERITLDFFGAFSF